MFNFAPIYGSFKQEYTIKIAHPNITIIGTRVKPLNIFFNESEHFTVHGKLKIEIVYHDNHDMAAQNPQILANEVPFSYTFAEEKLEIEKYHFEIRFEGTPRIINYRIIKKSNLDSFLLVKIIGQLVAKVIPSIEQTEEMSRELSSSFDTSKIQNYVKHHRVLQSEDNSLEEKISTLNDQIKVLSIEVQEIKNQIRVDKSPEKEQIETISHLINEIKLAKSEFSKIKNDINNYQIPGTNISEHYLATLSGNVKDYLTQKPLPQVIIEVSPLGTEEIVSKSASDGEGKFEIKLLPGYYQLRLRKNRFLLTRLTGLILKPGEIKKQDILMKRT